MAVYADTSKASQSKLGTQEEKTAFQNITVSGGGTHVIRWLVLREH